MQVLLFLLYLTLDFLVEVVVVSVGVQSHLILKRKRILEVAYRYPFLPSSRTLSYRIIDLGLL